MDIILTIYADQLAISGADAAVNRIFVSIAPSKSSTFSEASPLSPKGCNSARASASFPSFSSASVCWYCSALDSAGAGGRLAAATVGIGATAVAFVTWLSGAVEEEGVDELGSRSQPANQNVNTPKLSQGFMSASREPLDSWQDNGARAPFQDI